MKKQRQKIDSRTTRLLEKVKEFELLFWIMEKDPVKVAEFIRTNSVPIDNVIKLMEWHSLFIKGLPPLQPLPSEDELALQQIKRDKGTQAMKDKKENQYLKTKQILIAIEAKGIVLPIQAKNIEDIIHPLWDASVPPKQRTLLTHQQRYLNEKLGKG